MKYNFGLNFEVQEEISKQDGVDSDQKLLKDIRGICRMIDDAYARFQMQADDDLVEASIYEIEALKSRYRYLLRLAKNKNVTCNTCATTLYEKI